MKLIHLLAGIATAAGAVAGGTKAYVHYQVKSGIDDLIAAARPFADIRYDDLDTDLSGSATLRRLSILPREFPDHFEVDALTVNGPDMDFLLSGFKDAGRRGKFPEHAAIEIRGWHVRADSALVRALQKSTARLAEMLNIDSDSCSLGQMFGAKELAALGHDGFLIDMGMGYRFTDTFPGIELNWEFTTPGERGRFSMTLTDVDNGMTPSLKTMPKLREAELTYHLDPAFTRKTVEHCARLRTVDRDTYIAQLAAEPDILYQVYMGFVPGPGLRQAFQELLRNPGELQASARPIDPLDLSTLGLYQPSQLPDLLGLSVAVNGQPVEDLSLSFVDISAQLDAQMREEIERGGLMSELGFAPTEPAAAAPVPDLSSRATPPPGFKGVGQAQLGEHVGRQVRIVGTGGRKRNGMLKSVERGIATVEERRHGGTLTSTIALKEIVSAEVFY